MTLKTVTSSSGIAIEKSQVAEWVGVHYGRNFDAEHPQKKQEWIDRFVEASESAIASVQGLPTWRSTQLVFVRYEGAEVTTVGLLSLETTLESDDEVKAALIDATTHWVKMTKAGRSLWSYSCADLNIGDLASSSVFEDAAYLAALLERGVKYVNVFAGDCSDAIAYDEVLVNEDQIDDEEALATEGQAQ